MTSEQDQRLVLKGVPSVHFYQGGKRCPEDFPFPSCIRAVFEYLDEGLQCRMIPHRTLRKVGCPYSFFMGVSGAAWRLSWKPGWHQDNMEMMYMSDDPWAPFRRSFAALGYSFEPVMIEPGRDNKAFFRDKIIESIRDKGRPVIAFGIIGPPEACLITGYDEAGEVMIGWNFFQKMPEFNQGVEFEEGGQFRQRHWFQGQDDSIFLIGDKGEQPNPQKVYYDALEWALQVIRTPQTTIYGGLRHNGLAAYDAWAEHVERDSEWPAGDEAVLRAHHRIHDDAISIVAEGRFYGALFLMDTNIPDPLWTISEEMIHAAACFTKEHELMWDIWDLAGGIGNPDAWQKMADPAVRRQIAAVIRASRAKDAEAAGYIEQALNRWKTSKRLKVPE